jgi:plasmid stabilization system protein ParE
VKTYKLRILTHAQKELEDIARIHLELVGPASARGITDRIYGALERLTTFPLSGALPKDRQLRGAGYRFVVTGKYLCFYRLIEDTVYVYHIVHGATDYPQLFSDLPETSEI